MIGHRHRHGKRTRKTAGVVPPGTIIPGLFPRGAVLAGLKKVLRDFFQE
jgi:hypothetical protein